MIGKIAPLTEPVPPRFYGGTERIVSYLTEGLVSLGHDVTLFASGDSITSARLISCCTEGVAAESWRARPDAQIDAMLDKVRRMAPIFHFQIDQCISLYSAILRTKP